LGKTIGEDIEIVPRTGAVSDVILADRGQLEQVLMNLAVNARDAMPDGGRLFIETADLAVEAGGGEAEDGIAPGVYVVLEVRDTGVGMSRETLSRIFDPFFTTKGAGHGTGLGLATVSGIVGQHKGYIRAVSEPGRGACFRVFWPAAAAEAEAAEGAGAAAGPERCGGGKVLVVDDDEHVRQLVCDVLENHGCRCMAAASGEEALAIPPEKLREVDLVMTDVIMSGMNGREMAQRIRQRHPAAAIVFMSGYTDEVITRHGVLEEGVHFLPKPLSVSAILAKVNEVLAGS
ncbi:MAG: ATP-binding protein, partial [Thermodesulfobacteriota bacterium]